MVGGEFDERRPAPKSPLPPPALASALGQCSPNRVVELSGVAKLPHVPLIATLLIYRALYQDSVRCGDRLWVMAVMPTLRTTLRLVTPGAIKIGPRAVPMRDGYPGQRPQLRAYPAWGRVDTLTSDLRAAANAAADDGYRRFLRIVATFMDDRTAHETSASEFVTRELGREARVDCGPRSCRKST